MPIIKEFQLNESIAVIAIKSGKELYYLGEYLQIAGAVIFIIAQTNDILREAREIIGKETMGTVVDMTNRANIVEVKNRIVSQFSRIDILVTDSRWMVAKPICGITENDWDETNVNNCRTTFFLCQVFAEVMKQQEYGRIVNIASELGDRAVADCSIFSASQATVLSLTKSFTIEYAKFGLRINCIATGWTLAEDIPLNEQQKELLVRYIPLRRKGTPADLAPLLIFLCSKACDYTTGQPIFIDGGLTARP
jgi:NAD(P)-dependent dehydrogenase (short-subunit alcohol dehydrogenase family)